MGLIKHQPSQSTLRRSGRILRQEGRLWDAVVERQGPLEAVSLSDLISFPICTRYS